MNGVACSRVKLAPAARCLERACHWRAGTRGLGSEEDLHAEAARHARDTGHEVQVSSEDITRYQPQSEQAS